jgi:cytochrome c peroxidase
MKKILLTAFALILVFCVGSVAGAVNLEEVLGGFLYFDENLSSPAGQSCASCHLPKAGFADPDKSLPVSEGVIPGRFGTRNAPSAAYASYSPSFFFDGELWIGGQFWDGRALTLVE